MGLTLADVDIKPEASAFEVQSDDAMFKELQADITSFNLAMERAYTKSNGELCIPGMEGIGMRILNTIYNVFQQEYNYYTTLITSFEALFKQDWVLFCRRWLKILQDNPPESEAFSGCICLCGTKQRTEQHIACIQAVCQLTANLDKELLSTDKSMMTRNIQNVVNYLSSNHCTVDISRPSKSKAATRFTYGDIKRIGNMGYGNDPTMFVNMIGRYLDKYADLYTQLVKTDNIGKAIDRMDAEIKKLEAQTANNDKKRAELVERINNIRARFTTVRGIIRATTDFYQTTLITDFILPLKNIGMIAGIRDDLFTWIFATRD